LPPKKIKIYVAERLGPSEVFAFSGRDSKSEYRNPKQIRIPDDKNTNNKNLNPFSYSPLQNSSIGYSYQALCFCFHRLKHLNIRI
jgi:hypothetical protein